jgi:hypothetical protein
MIDITGVLHISQAPPWLGMANAALRGSGSEIKLTRRCVMPLSSLAFAFGLLLLVPAGWASAAEKHSGTVVAADEAQITIEEMGPWHGPGTQPIRRTVKRNASTRVVLAERVSEGADGWRWAFSDRSAESSDPHVGDFVTVTTEPLGSGTVAVEVLVVWPGTHLEVPGNS